MRERERASFLWFKQNTKCFSIKSSKKKNVPRWCLSMNVVQIQGNKKYCSSSVCAWIIDNFLLQFYFSLLSSIFLKHNNSSLAFITFKKTKFPFPVPVREFPSPQQKKGKSFQKCNFSLLCNVIFSSSPLQNFFLSFTFFSRTPFF